MPNFVGFSTVPWNKGRLIGPEAPAQAQGGLGNPGPASAWNRDLALFNLAIDGKLRACDLVSLPIDDVCVGGRVRNRATVIQKKTGQFEITEQTRSSVRDWLSEASSRSGHYLFPGRGRGKPHLSTRQYARIVRVSIESAGLDNPAYGTHSMHRAEKFAAEFQRVIMGENDRVEVRSFGYPVSGYCSNQRHTFSIEEVSISAPTSIIESKYGLPGQENFRRRRCRAQHWTTAQGGRRPTP